MTRLGDDPFDPYRPGKSLIGDDGGNGRPFEAEKLQIVMSVGGLLGATFKLFSRGFAQAMAVAMIPNIVSTGPLLLLDLVAPDMDGAVPFLVGILGTMVRIVSIPATIMVFHDTALVGSPEKTIRRYLKLGMERTPRIWGGHLLMWLVFMGAGLIALVTTVTPNVVRVPILVALVPGLIYVAVRWIFLFPLITVDRRRVFEAVRASSRLIVGRFWRVCLTWIVLATLCAGVVTVFFILLVLVRSGELGPNLLASPVSIIGGSVFESLFLCILMAFLTATYVAARQDSERIGASASFDGSAKATDSNLLQLNTFPSTDLALPFLEVLDDNGISYEIVNPTMRQLGHGSQPPVTVMVDRSEIDTARAYLSLWEDSVVHLDDQK